MKVVIIEEEEPIARRLQDAIGKMQEDFRHVDTLRDFPEFEQYLKKNAEPDLVLMDIFQLDPKALRFLQSGYLKAALLCTNSLKKKEPGNSSANHGDTTSLYDDLYKKQQSALLARRIADKCIEPGKPGPANYQDRFLVKTRQNFLSVKIEQIAFFYAEGRLNYFKTKDNRKYIIPYTMETLSYSLLDPRKFFRVNRSTIVSFDNLKEMIPYFGGRIKLAMHTPSDKDIIVSREKVNDFKKWLGE